WMTHDTLDTLYNSGTEGPVTITSQDFQNINPGDSAIVYYGMALGSSFIYVKAGLDSLSAIYNSILTSVTKNTVNNSPHYYKLNQNYPNPFNPSTTISFSIPVQENVSIVIYNILGMKVATLLNEVKAAGNYTLSFNARNLPSGIYFYKLESGSYTSVKKMILIK
ncbi:MAG: T9SS type A sorting domain-containing protein, partial [Ignavibacteriaceae bacterium]|nr:T9SS type A sorting domain-containing protein [Ignavibacteriaceae bacterium]